MSRGLSLWCPLACLADGWTENVLFRISADGIIERLEPGAPAAGHDRLPGIAIPGMPNLHSHAFQRAMAGLAERAGGADNFWSWRQTMYDFVERLSPDQVEAIAAQLYVEMLKAGYTGVAEFHYLHNPPGGGRYDDPAELARRVAAGAGSAGIRLSLMPVLYRDGGFGGAPIGKAQRRFRLEVSDWVDIVAALYGDGESGGGKPAQSTAAALHSLRAVPLAAMAEALAAYGSLRPAGPIHIHIAEQVKEVADCEAWSGRRPVEWLLDHAPVDRRWTLVHATHVTAAERSEAAGAGAMAGLCPTTEANLGDGIFDFPAWLGAGGAFGIGSDSNVSVDPREELRWLEYMQRSANRKRLVSLGVHPPSPTFPGTCPNGEGGKPASLGELLWNGAVRGGAQAMGQPCGALAEGAAADFLVLDPSHPTLANHDTETLLDAWIFSNNGSALKEVRVGGRRVVADGRHAQEDRIAARYRAALADLLDTTAR